jgi:hypothetical protein
LVLEAEGLFGTIGISVFTSAALRVGYDLHLFGRDVGARTFVNGHLLGLLGYRLSMHSTDDDGHFRRTRSHTLQPTIAYDLYLGRRRTRFLMRTMFSYDRAISSKEVGPFKDDPTFSSPIFKHSITLGASLGLSF